MCVCVCVWVLTEAIPVKHLAQGQRRAAPRRNWTTDSAGLLVTSLGLSVLLSPLNQHKLCERERVSNTNVAIAAVPQFSFKQIFCYRLPVPEKNCKRFSFLQKLKSANVTIRLYCKWEMRIDQASSYQAVYLKDKSSVFLHAIFVGLSMFLRRLYFPSWLLSLQKINK